MEYNKSDWDREKSRVVIPKLKRIFHTVEYKITNQEQVGEHKKKQNFQQT